MTSTNLLKQRVQIQIRSSTITAIGEAIVWSPSAARYARIVPLKAEARAVYQQMNSVVSHKIIFSKGVVSLSLGNNRILHGSKIYEPVESPQTIGNSMVVMVKEV